MINHDYKFEPYFEVSRKNIVPYYFNTLSWSYCA